MPRRGFMGLAAVGAVATLALAACGGGSSSSGGGGGGSSSSAGFNAAVTKVVNPSNTKTSGTIYFGNSSTPDSTDPGNTYYAMMWNFSRLYTMPLMTYASCPGSCGLKVVPDLATAPGVVSDNGLTWTYHIKPNVKFEDGTTVTSADVKYAVERTFDRTLFPLGPSYFPLLLAPQKPAYPGPYKDRSKNIMGLKAVQTPNPTTIVFHLAHPFADFNYVTAIPQTAPVPPNKDTGANYQLHPWSTGPYKFQSYQLNKQLTLVPNTFWNPATDPNAKQLVSKIVVTMNMNANDIDNRLLAGDLNVDMAGTGVQAAARAKILSTPLLEGLVRRPGERVPLVRLPQHGGAADEQRALPDGHRVRGQQGEPADRLRRPSTPVARSRRTVSPPNVIGHKAFDLLRRAEQAARGSRGRQGAAQAVRAPVRVHHRDRLPQRPAQGGRGRHRAAAGAVPGGHQDHAARVPDRHLLRQLRGRAEVRAPARPGHRLRWLGAGLAGRLRLLRLHHRRRHHQPGGQLQRRGAERPGRQQRPSQDGRHQRPRDPQRLHQPDRHAGDEGRRHPAGGVRQVAALPQPAADQRVRPVATTACTTTRSSA